MFWIHNYECHCEYSAALSVDLTEVWEFRQLEYHIAFSDVHVVLISFD